MNNAYHETQLPSEYTLLFSIDLQNNKKQATIVNGLGIVIAIILFVIGTLFVPFSTFTEGAISEMFLKYGVTVIGFVVYIVLHECIHGIAMKTCGTKKIKYGFTGMYAFAGSDDYYYKWPYIYIALAPIVLFLFILGIAIYFVPFNWFWPIYLVQIMNVSGACGDIYVTLKMLKCPKNILIKDEGTSMNVYAKK